MLVLSQNNQDYRHEYNFDLTNFVFWFIIICSASESLGMSLPKTIPLVSHLLPSGGGDFVDSQVVSRITI